MALTVMLAAVDISDRLVGETAVEAIETAARIAELSYLPVLPTSPGSLLGQALAISGPGGTMFTGVVDDASQDLLTGVVTIRGTDRLQEHAAQMTEAQILAAVPGGLYPVALFGPRQSGWEQLQDVLMTALAGYSLAADGTTGRVHVWTTTGDPIAVDSNIVDGSLRESRPSLSALVSVVEVQLEARFARRWHRTVSAAWAAYGNFCDWFDDPTTLPTIDMIEGAATGTDWKISGQADVAECDPESDTQGIFSEGLPASHSNCTAPWVLNADPDNVTARVSAAWTAYSRYVQWIREVYAITVTASGAPATTSAEQTWRVEQEYESDAWEGSVGDGLAPAGGIAIAGGIASDVVDRTEINEALTAAVRVAAYECIEAARDWTWTYQIPIDASVDIGQRRSVSASGYSATGAVVRVRHELDHDTGRATTEIELALGGGSVDEWALPDPPDSDDGYSSIGAEISLPNHIGNDENAPEDDCHWTGYVGNYQFLAAGGGHGDPDPEQIYQPRFFVEYPEIDASHRNERQAIADLVAVTLSMVYPS
jgi:hypothetical protein